MSDSLRDVEDLSIPFSIDADVNVNGELDAAARQKAVLDALTCRRQRPEHSAVVYGKVAAEELQTVFEKVMEAGRRSGDGRTGFVLSTGSTLAEALEALRLCHVAVDDLDALICGSRSELYYPWRDPAADVDYGTHVEYRWPGESVRSVAQRLAKLDDGAEDDLVVEDEACTSRCYAYSVKPQAKV